MNRRNRENAAFSLFSFQDIITSVTGVIMLVTLLLALKLTTQVVANSPVNSEEAEALSDSIRESEQSIASLRAYLEEHSLLDEKIGNYTPQSATKELAAVTEELRLISSKLADLKREKLDMDGQVDAAEHRWLDQSEDVELLNNSREELAAAQRELTELTNSQRVFYNQSDEGGRQVYIIELFDSDILVAPAGIKGEPRRFSGQYKKKVLTGWAKSMSPTSVRFVIIIHPGTTDLFREIQAELKGNGFKIGYDLLPRDKSAIDPKYGAG